MDEAEYTRLRRQIEAEYAQNLSALDRVWRLANGSTEPPVLTALSEEPRARSGRGEIMRAVRLGLDGLSGNFTWKTIREQLAQSRPGLPANRTTISQVLRKLTEHGEIVELEQGRGKLPSVYRTIQSTRGSETTAKSLLSQTTDLATELQIEEMKKLCLEGGYAVEEFKAEFINPLGYDRVGKMPRRLAHEVLKDVREACELRKLDAKPQEVKSQA